MLNDLTRTFLTHYELQKKKISKNRSKSEIAGLKYKAIERNSKALCVFYDGQVVSRTWKAKRHYKTNHKWL